MAAPHQQLRFLGSLPKTCVQNRETVIHYRPFGSAPWSNEANTGAASRARPIKWLALASVLLIGKGIRLVDYSPEKAGVGGSTPSLATTFKGT
jgi:hypothetical protein